MHLFIDLRHSTAKLINQYQYTSVLSKEALGLTMEHRHGALGVRSQCNMEKLCLLILLKHIDVSVVFTHDSIRPQRI